MVDICVIYAKEDFGIVSKLVMLLDHQWKVWWGDNINCGDWEKQVRDEISKAKSVLPVVSRYTEGKQIFKDELRLANELNKSIFPFFIEKADLPLGFGNLNRTEAFGWDGTKDHPGYLQLVKKISTEISKDLGEVSKDVRRVTKLELGAKTLNLPCFVFSLSSHETQIRPKDGIELFQYLVPPASLISAYDAWEHIKDTSFRKQISNLRKTDCVFFLDSGNYEAYRKNDNIYSNNKNRWNRKKFHQTAIEMSPDIVFAYDRPNPKGDINEISDRIIADFDIDKHAIGSGNFPICPIIHLPNLSKKGMLVERASEIIINVVRDLDPIMVAIPERELGDGLLQRIKTVREIRAALNKLDKSYPLHLLGTGNPTTMIALATAGADAFDGLEWCRTVADYNNWHLCHFQHFDCIWNLYKGRCSESTRRIIEDQAATYNMRVAVYNFDFFIDFMQTMRDIIYSGKTEYLRKWLPEIGEIVFQELAK